MKSKPIIKCTIFPAHSSAVSRTSYAAIPQKSLNLTKQILYPSKLPLLFSPQVLAAAMGLSVSMILASLGISCNQTILVFL